MEDAVTFMDRLKVAKFVMTSSRLTQGKEVKKFEQQWSEWLGVKHSLFVTSGSTANSLLVSAWKELNQVPDGAKVIVPACTWVTNIAPIIQNNLTPVFCDINLQNFSFDIASLLDIAAEHDDIRAIFVTHLLGFPANVTDFSQIFPNADILEDVCESHGAILPNTENAGTYDVGGTFSFYFGHHMTTVEGGMVSTNNSELYDLMRMKRSHGLARESTKFFDYANQHPEIIPQFLFMTDGYNFRNTDIAAVLGQSQLKRLTANIEIRNRNYEYFWDILSLNSEKFYIPENHIRVSNFCFPLICKTKNIYYKLIDELRLERIEFRPVVGGNLLKQPFLKGYEADCPNADILHDRGLYVGNSQFVTEQMIHRLAMILDRF